MRVKEDRQRDRGGEENCIALFEFVLHQYITSLRYLFCAWMLIPPAL